MTIEHQYDLTELLEYIDPANLEYQDWVNVGMALKDAGYPCSLWDEWSHRDAARYHAGDCAKKWDSFRGAPTPVTAGTIVQMAKDAGWRPANTGHELSWDDPIGAQDEMVIVKKGWVEGVEVKEPADWNPAEQLITYLDTLFNDDENVGYVTECFEKDDRLLPTSGNWDRTAGQLKAALKHCRGDIGAVMGDSNPKAGAWIRFNPLDGKGIRNDNVTDFRYALVESDSIDIDQQNAIIRELELPVACLVHSGGKSLHAIVRIDAPNIEEYRRRVEYLYDVCRKNGLQPDKQDKNPSRLSRMPGIMRGDHKQFLVATNIGKKDWAEWLDWFESVNDDLPDPETLTDAWNNMPPLAAPLIDGVLRQGHKMLLAGPSKAGKSFALIELTIAVAEGNRWLGWQCAQGRVLYVNLELDRASCLHRFRDVYDALHWQPNNLGNIDIWNLRGNSVPMDKLAPKLIRRAAKKNYIAVIIDPIYKVLTGDENSADQMAQFCNQFDKVCHELGAAVIYCHHHSKGFQGSKRSMDRASGSGVFARDPDAMLDLVQLETTPELMKQTENKAVCGAMEHWLNANISNWQNDVGQDDRLSETTFKAACKDLMLTSEQWTQMNACTEATRDSARHMTAWRIEGTLREFAKFDPINVWFDYPVHVSDDCGALKDIEPEDDTPPWKVATEKRKASANEARKSKKQEFEEAVQNCKMGDPPTVADIIEYFSDAENAPAERTVQNWVRKFGYMIDKNHGNVIIKNNGQCADA